MSYKFPQIFSKNLSFTWMKIVKKAMNESFSHDWRNFSQAGRGERASLRVPLRERGGSVFRGIGPGTLPSEGISVTDNQLVKRPHRQLVYKYFRGFKNSQCHMLKKQWRMDQVAFRASCFHWKVWSGFMCIPRIKMFRRKLWILASPPPPPLFFSPKTRL